METFQLNWRLTDCSLMIFQIFWKTSRLWSIHMLFYSDLTRRIIFLNKLNNDQPFNFTFLENKSGNLTAFVNNFRIVCDKSQFTDFHEYFSGFRTPLWIFQNFSWQPQTFRIVGNFPGSVATTLPRF